MITADTAHMRTFTFIPHLLPSLHRQGLSVRRASPRGRFRAVRDTKVTSRWHCGCVARILHDRLGPLAERVPTTEAPGDEPPELVIHNDRARNELGWRPRPAETTIVETAESLRDLGLLKR